MISNFFNFYWFFIGCFTEYDCNFDNTSKIGNSRPPWNKVSWNEFYCHNFCSWHHQQSFFTLLKLKCRCGHVRKFENQSILTREVIVTLFYKDLGRKTDCFEGGSWFKFDNMWLVQRMLLYVYLYFFVFFYQKICVFIILISFFMKYQNSATEY